MDTRHERPGAVDPGAAFYGEMAGNGDPAQPSIPIDLADCWRRGIEAARQRGIPTQALERMPGGPVDGHWWPTPNLWPRNGISELRLQIGRVAAACWEGQIAEGEFMEAGVRLLGTGHLSLPDTPEAHSLSQEVLIQSLGLAQTGRAHLNIVDPEGLGSSFSALNPLAAPDVGILRNIDPTKNWQHGAEGSEFQKLLTTLTGEIVRRRELVSAKQRADGSQYGSMMEYLNETGELLAPWEIAVIRGSGLNLNREQRAMIERILDHGAENGIHLVLHGVTTGDHDGLDRLEFTTDGMVQSSAYRANGVQLLIRPDRASDHDVANAVHQIAEAAREGPPPPSLEDPSFRPERFWNKSPRDGITVPIGKNVETGDVVEASLGLMPEQSSVVIIGGSPGNGKTNILHTAANGIMVNYRPEEVCMDMIDFSGVEAGVYQGVPHVGTLAVKPEAEHVVSYMRGLHAEMEQREEVMRNHGANNIIGLWDKGVPISDFPMRVILFSEFQRLFDPQNPAAMGEARDLLIDLMRRGRKLGLLVVGDTQTTEGISALWGMEGALNTLMKSRIGVGGSRNLFDPASNIGALDGLRPREAVINTNGGVGRENNVRIRVPYAGHDATQRTKAEIGRLPHRAHNARIIDVSRSADSHGNRSREKRKPGGTPHIELGRSTSEDRKPAEVELSKHVAIIAATDQRRPEANNMLTTAALSWLEDGRAEEGQAAMSVIGLGTSEEPATTLVNELDELGHPAIAGAYNRAQAKQELEKIVQSLAGESSKPQLVVVYGADALSMDPELKTLLRTILHRGHHSGVHVVAQWRDPSALNGLSGMAEDSSYVNAADLFSTAVTFDVRESSLNNVIPNTGTSAFTPRPRRAYLYDKLAARGELIET